jgi:hypothetical protein
MLASSLPVFILEGAMSWSQASTVFSSRAWRSYVSVKRLGATSSQQDLYYPESGNDNLSQRHIVFEQFALLSLTPTWASRSFLPARRL